MLKSFGSRVNNRQYFHMKNSLSMKKLSINDFTTKLFIVPLKWTPIYIVKFFGHLPRVPLDPGTPMGHLMGV